jgi:hypothetical protein
MAIQRIGAARPQANQTVSVSTFSESYLISVIATNIVPTTTPIPRASVFVIPAGSDTEGSYVYLAANISIGYGSSFETFRFAVNPGDQIAVRSTAEGVSFSVYGILQDDVIGPGDLPQVFNNKVIRGNNNVIYVERGNTSQRNPSAEEGYIRYNTDFQTLEIRTASGWKRVAVVD